MRCDRAQPTRPPSRSTPTRGSVGEVAAAFLKLGLTSFGGPIAHLGYFRAELVERRRWIDEKGYGELVALSQVLPGPASSQVGFALGLLRAGPLGALAAFLAFTLPSAILLVGVRVRSGLARTARSEPVCSPGSRSSRSRSSRRPCGGWRASSPPTAAAPRSPSARSWSSWCGVARSAQVAAIALGAVAGLLFCRTRRRRAAEHAALPDLEARGCRRPQPLRRVARRACRSSPPLCGRPWSPSPTLSTVPGRWCSGEATSCCRCSRRRSSTRGGSGTASSSRATGLRRPCPARSSVSRRTSGRSSSPGRADGGDGHRGCRAGSGRDLPAGVPHPDRRSAVLERAARHTRSPRPCCGERARRSSASSLPLSTTRSSRAPSPTAGPSRSPPCCSCSSSRSGCRPGRSC